MGQLWEQKTYRSWLNTKFLYRIYHFRCSVYNYVLQSTLSQFLTWRSAKEECYLSCNNHICTSAQCGFRGVRVLLVIKFSLPAFILRYLCQGQSSSRESIGVLILHFWDRRTSYKTRHQFTSCRPTCKVTLWEALGEVARGMIPRCTGRNYRRIGGDGAVPRTWCSPSTLI